MGVSLGMYLIADAARAAMITMFVATLGCIVAAAFAIPMSKVPGQPALEAFFLARVMAVLGGVAGLAGGIVATIYFFLVGEASPRAFLLIEMALLGACVVFWVSVSAMMHASESRTD